MEIKRYKNNPILVKGEDNAWENLCVLNPGVIYDENRKKFVMLYRAGGDDLKHMISVGIAESDDGFHFKRMSDRPVLDPRSDLADGECLEDVRIVCLDGIYYITYAGRFRAVGKYWLSREDYIALYGEVKLPEKGWPRFVRNNHTVSYLAATKDFKTFLRLGRITDSRYDDRDVLLFPEKVNGQYVRISRPKFPPTDECPAPAIWITMSNDIVEWGEPALLMKGKEWWETERIGAAAPPVKTDIGWIMLYHGVEKRADGKDIYRVGAVLLDKDDPRKILARTREPIMEPQEDYERRGLFGECIFPTANIVLNGTVYIYYGCADQTVGMATVPLEELVRHMQLCKEEMINDQSRKFARNGESREYTA